MFGLFLLQILLKRLQLEGQVNLLVALLLQVQKGCLLVTIAKGRFHFESAGEHLNVSVIKIC